MAVLGVGALALLSGAARAEEIVLECRFDHVALGLPNSERYAPAPVKPADAAPFRLTITESRVSNSRGFLEGSNGVGNYRIRIAPDEIQFGKSARVGEKGAANAITINRQTKTIVYQFWAPEPKTWFGTCAK